MALTELFTPTFFMTLGILLLALSFLIFYFENKMREQNHKITSMFSLVSSMAEELNHLRGKVNYIGSGVLPHSGSGPGMVGGDGHGNGQVSSNPGQVPYFMSSAHLDHSTSKIEVSDEEDDEEDEDDDDEEEDDNDDEEDDETEEDDDTEEDDQNDDEEAEDPYHAQTSSQIKVLTLGNHFHLKKNNDGGDDDEEGDKDMENMEEDIQTLGEFDDSTDDDDDDDDDSVSLNETSLDQIIESIESIQIDTEMFESIEKEEENENKMAENKPESTSARSSDLKTIHIVDTTTASSETGASNTKQIVTSTSANPQQHYVDYKKMTIQKLRSIAVDKGLVSSGEVSKLKKNDLFKLLGVDV